MKTVWLASTAMALLAATSGAAFAQQGPTAAVPGGPTGGATLAEVVVTAQKRVENVQKTPIAITAISGDDIRGRSETQLDTTLRNVPSLQIQNTPQGGEIYIRGVGANGDSSFIDPSVALSIDDVYTGRSERLSAGLYDISRIEVLRGPQGTLYGRNADGGSVNIITADPIIGSHESKLNFTLGNYDLRHIDGAQNIPLGDQFALRIAAMREDRNGYFTNDGYASHVTGARAKALWRPTDALIVKALFDYSQQTGHFATSVPVPGPLPPGPFPAGGWPTDPNNPWFVDSIHPADTINYTFATAALRVDYAMPWGVLTVIPAFTRSKRYVDTNLVVGALFGPLTPGTDREDQKTIEARLASPASSRIKWIVGYYYLWSNNSLAPGAITSQNANLPGGSNVTLFNSITEAAPPTTSMAPFAQVTFPITDRFRITGGARYTEDTKAQAVRVVSVDVPGYDSGILTSKVKFRATTWKGGAEFDLAPQSMLYAQVAKGYKAGGYDTTAVPPKTYQPETVVDCEIGSKNRFFDDKVQINASLYYYQYDNIQVQYNPAANPPLPIPAAYIPEGASYGYFQQYVANGGAGVNKGTEVEARWRITADDELDVSATYTDAHYGKFSDPNLAGLSGEVMAVTPKETLIANYAHTWPLLGGRLTLQADTRVSSSYWSSVNNRGSRPASFQGAYTRSDASLAFDSGGFWTLSVWVKNIENGAQVQFGDFPLNRNVINFPRTFGTNLALNF